MENLAHLWLALVAGWHFFCAHLAPIGAALVPMLIASWFTGITYKPGQGDNKIVTLLKLFARFCGWAVHYDEAGSVKLPAGELLGLVFKGLVLVYRAFKGSGAPLALALLSAFLALPGCATAGTPPGATMGQKFRADVSALEHVAQDVKDKCGPEFTSLGPVVASILTIAANPYDALGDIVAIAAAYPAVAGDVKALACVVKTVIDDFKALKPASATSSSAAHAVLIGVRVYDILLHAPDPAVARAQIATILSTPEVCSNATEDGADVCRPFSEDDGMQGLPVATGAR